MNTTPLYKDSKVRLLQIYSHLKKTEGINVKELAAIFGVKERTIQRDIKELQLVIQGENGYVLAENIDGSGIKFTKEQAAALLVAEKLTEEFTETAHSQHFRQAIGKIKTELKRQDANYLKSLEQIRVYKLTPTAPSKELKENHSPSETYFSDLHRAIAERHYIDVHYYSRHQDCEMHYKKLEPVTFTYYLDNWYVLARNSENKERVVCRFEGIKTCCT